MSFRIIFYKQCLCLFLFVQNTSDYQETFPFHQLYMTYLGQVFTERFFEFC